MRGRKTDEENVEQILMRVEANDPASICKLAAYYYHRLWNFYAKAPAELGFTKAHYSMGNIYNIRGDLKKAKVHYEAAAMAGHELALSTLVETNELHSGNTTRAIKIGQLAACWLNVICQ